MSFNVLDEESVQSGMATDEYFLNTEASLEGAGKNPEVVAEMTESQMPNGEFRVFSGLADIAELFEGLNVDIDALPEGMPFDGGPVLRIRGPYREFARFETSLLGFASQASAFATAATVVRSAAPNTTTMSFGGRHLNPFITPVLERNAMIADLDGISHVAAGDMIDVNPTGTMPHALIIPFGRSNQEEAWSAFNEYVSEDASRIALCDTFSDEVDEVRRVIAELGDDVDGVRLDTTGSRRGDFAQIIKEVRWALEELGRENVDIVVSGGITPDTMRDLREIVDGFGVGSYISNASPLDFGLDIVEVDGEPIAKRGKYSGVKEVYRTPTAEHQVISAEKEVPATWTNLMEPLIRDGEIVREISLENSSRTLSNQLEIIGAEKVSRK
jgi:nicotinate phosphoribosyltransferase